MGIIELRMKMGNVSKRQQPDHVTDIMFSGLCIRSSVHSFVHSFVGLSVRLSVLLQVPYDMIVLILMQNYRSDPNFTVN